MKLIYVWELDYKIVNTGNYCTALITCTALIFLSQEQTKAWNNNQFKFKMYANFVQTYEIGGEG